MFVRQCGKSGKHKGTPIQAFCLGPNCQEDRILCCFCVYEQHIEHTVVYFRLEPQQIQSAQQKRLKALEDQTKHYFETVFKHIPERQPIEFFGSIEEAQKQKETVRDRIFSGLSAFFKIAYDLIKHDITSNIPLSKDIIKKYTHMLRLVEFPNQNTVQLLRDIYFENLSKMSQPMKDALGKTYQVLKNFQMSLVIFKMPVQLPQQIPSPVLPLPATQKFQQIIQKKTIKNMKVLEKSTLCVRRPYMKVNRKSAPVTRPLIKRKNKNDQSSESESSQRKPKKASQYDEEQQNNYQDGSNQDSSSQSYEGLSSQSSFQEQPTLGKNEPIPYPRVTKKISEAMIECHTTQHLNSILITFDPEVIRRLCIKCNTIGIMLNYKSIRLISSMRNLVSLKIYLAFKLSEKSASQLLKNLQFLEQLVLAEFVNFGDLLVSQMIDRNPRLKRICFTNDMDCINHEQLLEFVPDLHQGRNSQERWIALTRSHLELTNIEIQDGDNTAYWAEYISRNKERLNEITICNTSIEKQVKIDYTELFQSLTQCKNLQYLRLEHVIVSPRYLNDLIHGNPKLKAINLSECTTNKTTARAISQLKDLKYFFISLDDSYCSKFPLTSDKIETLIIRGCYGQTSQYLANNLKDRQQLKNLSINYSKAMVNIHSMASIANCSEIRYLNLSYNRFASNLLLKLREMTNIQCFICLQSGVSYRKVAECMFAPNLKKLSISGTTYNNNQEDLEIEFLVNSFPNLTHLKILRFGKLIGDLNMFSRIKFLASVIGGKFGKQFDRGKLKEYMQSRKIYFKNVSR